MVTKNIHIEAGKKETIVLEDPVLSVEVTLKKNASVTIYDIEIDQGDTDRHITVSLEGENSETHILGLHVLSGKMKSSSNIEVRHMVGNCESTQTYRAILDDNARSNFEGKIYVAEGADGTNAQQESKNLLLSDTATITALPSLEIYAEDVKCNHGATSGQLDPEALFYMRARGIGAEEAKKLLTYAFASEIIQQVELAPLREKLENFLSKRLKQSCAHVYKAH